MQVLTRNATQAVAGMVIGTCLLAGSLQANIGIKPAFVEVNMDAGRPSGVFLISNLGDKEERFRINAVHFTYTEKGGLRRARNGRNSLAPWIRFNPRELTLAPKTQRAVRFAVVPRGKLTQGEWWAAMELESLEVNEIVSKADKGGRSVKLKAIASIMAPIFGSVGKTTYEGRISDLRIQTENGGTVLKALLTATGNARLGLTGSYEIQDLAGTTISSGSFGSAYVLRDSQRWLTRKVEGGTPNSEYTLKVRFTAAHLEKPLVKETRITWPEAAAPATETVTGPAVETPSKEQRNQS